MKFPALKAKLMDDWLASYGGRTQKDGSKDPLHPPRRADMVLIEEKGSGISIVQELRLANVPVKSYNPGHASKIARAQAASAVLDADRVYVLESKKNPGKPVSWVQPLLTQCEEFPNGEHDDLVDTLTQTLIYVNHANLVVLDGIPDEEETERDYTAKRRTNPYG
jgi:predicted phage terminase large subunit-like protein